MRATISKNGTLIITAENELESYALQKWNDYYRTDEKEFVPRQVQASALQLEYGDD